MNDIRLSATVITFNEEKNIGRCLTSLSRIADEIIIVDSFSTDRTREVCQTFDVTFIENKFLGHIQQKNFAVAQTTNPYVLSLDADEELSDELIASIKIIKKNWVADAYVCNRLNSFCGKWIRYGLWYPDRKIRIWRKEKGTWAGENPHDKLTLDLGASLRNINGQILHYTVDNLQNYQIQIEKFSSIQAENLRRKGLRPHFGHLYIKPLYKFILAFVIRLGFLDGRKGYQIAKGQALGVYLRYIKLRQTQ